VSSNRNDDYLERVKAEIRAEADAARTRTPLPRHEVPAAQAHPAARQDGIERDRLDYTINELAGTQYSAFIDQAFRALLKRPPDEAGSAIQIRLLAAGASKAEVLGNLRWSPEGRRVGTRVRGLLPRYAQAKLARVPVLGYLVDWGLALAGLPILLRHQRAADTSVAARFDAALGAQRTHADRLAALDTAVSELGAERDRRNADAEAQREHGRRLDELTSRIAAFSTEHDRRSTALVENQRRVLQRLDELEHRAEVMRNRIDAAHSQVKALHDRGDALEGRAVAFEGRAVALESRLTPLDARAAALEVRTATLEGRNDAGANEMIELRHYVHAANHWIATLQGSLADLEETAAAERANADALAAALDAGNKVLTARATRHVEWAAKLDAVLPAAARALDLGSGDGAWLGALTAQGVSASGIESNQALAARAQESNLPIASGDPLATLSRCTEASLDAITLDTTLLTGDDVLVARAFVQIQRALKPGARVLLRVNDEPHRLGSLFGQRSTDTDAQRWAALLAAGGFTDVRVLPATGAAAVLAQRATS
jgi:predicted  nucleic acid-binding Zn-ribbon protein